ncbi:RNA polymerase sigma-70 factor [Phocaeicola sp.]
MEVTELLKHIQKHDSEQAFRSLYNLYYDRFFRIAFYYLQRDEWAQEVVLDVFAGLWNNRKRQLLPDDFNKYTYALVRNAALNYLEKEQHREAAPLDNIPEQSSPAPSPEEGMMNEELFSIYENSLNELPERCREIFIKVREEKQSYAAVAEKLNISPKTVDAQLQKAVARLKEKINNYFKGKA